ncbi:hypothetical protein H632_c1053p1 [Helicosporidium sp. ATCC 50920]|nr:hypothetical protein H632_c1053p1 [Helicosporidium sp. ATCC 50920]|eukprot:KDD74820.1 hypothetical protein H632_c1053p1 [Helicosporidium sp. ATCC 50920]
MPATLPAQAVLLAGFTREEGLRVRRWFEEMEPGFRVAPISPKSLSDETLGEALETSLRFLARTPHSWLYSPRDAPPAAFLCGLSGEEMVGVVEHWQAHVGLPRPLFAQLTPEAARRPLGLLLAEMVRAAPRAETSGTGVGQNAAGWGEESEAASWDEESRAMDAGEEPGMPELSDAERARAWASIKKDIHRRAIRGPRRRLSGRNA